MGRKYGEIAFTDTVRHLQSALGSRRGYEAMARKADAGDRFDAEAAAFIGARDSFYMASVSGTGWPYMQHRGGPAGFVRVLDDRTLGFADFRGNKQYISVGNLLADDRVSLFFIDYANRARLKIFGRARLVGAGTPASGTSGDDAALLARLDIGDYGAVVERGIVIAVEAFDWNCPQHITPRYTLGDVETAAALRGRIGELEALLRQHGIDEG